MSDIKKILLVDDDRDLLTLIIKHLKKQNDGYEYIECTTGGDAIEMIRAHAVDLVVTDIYMPDINGFDLLMEVKKHHPDIKVIMMTGYSTPELHNQAFQNGSVGFIEKPFEPKELLTLITSAFEKSVGSFQGEMEGIQIPDIIQLNCLARVTNAVNFRSGGREGVIFFDNGEIVHAESNGTVGEAAFREILSWPGGQFSTQRNTAPTQKSINKKWEQLLMENVVSVDEMQRKDFVLDEEIVVDNMERTSESPDGKIRVLVVDDSKIISRGISDILSTDTGIEVVETARDGKDALIKLAQHNPDVVTMDVNMPEMDGLTALKHIMIMQPTPVVMLSSYTVEGARTTFDSFRFGAVDFIAKPNSRQDLSLEEQKKSIIEKIKRAAQVRISSIQHIRVTENNSNESDISAYGQADTIVAVGAAMGGYGSLMKLITRFPKDINASVLAVQYMPNDIVESFAEYLNTFSRMTVKSATDGEEIKKSVCYLTSDGNYMTVVDDGGTKRIRLHERPFNFEHQNSFNMLLLSLAETCKDRAIGVIMTGEHDDGIEGAREVKQRGGLIFAQEEKTCLYPQMPAAVIADGIVDGVFSDISIAFELEKVLEKI